MDVMNIVRGVVFVVPVLVTLLTEIAKRIPQIPVSSKNAKWAALGLSVVLVAGLAYDGGTLTKNLAVTNALEVVATYAVAVGLYETFKNLINKI